MNVAVLLKQVGCGGGCHLKEKNKTHIKCIPTSHSSLNSFEHLAFIVKVKVPVLILILYNPQDPADFIETLDRVLYSGLSPDNFETKNTCASKSIWFYLQ